MNLKAIKYQLHFNIKVFCDEIHVSQHRKTTRSVIIKIYTLLKPKIRLYYIPKSQKKIISIKPVLMLS